MANLIDIRRRIRSVQNTRQITRAMKFVSAAKLRKAQDRIFAARPYTRRMFQLIHHLALTLPDQSHPLLADRGDANILLVVVTGDKGLCGAFNTNIIRTAAGFAERPGGAVLDLVGKKGYDHFHRRRYNIFAHYVNRLSQVDMALAEEIAGPLEQAFLDGRADQVHIVYNQFKSVSQQAIAVEQLLPIRELEMDAADEAAGPPIEYLFDLPRAEVFAELFPRHLRVQIYHALLESVASEHSARMKAMEAATQNAGEMIDRLVLFRNRVRQAAITKEIIEIVSGASALD